MTHKLHYVFLSVIINCNVYIIAIFQPNCYFTKQIEVDYCIYTADGHRKNLHKLMTFLFFLFNIYYNLLIRSFVEHFIKFEWSITHLVTQVIISYSLFYLQLWIGYRSLVTWFRDFTKMDPNLQFKCMDVCHLQCFEYSTN